MLVSATSSKFMNLANDVTSILLPWFIGDLLLGENICSTKCLTVKLCEVLSLIVVGIIHWYVLHSFPTANEVNKTN